MLCGRYSELFNGFQTITEGPFPFDIADKRITLQVQVFSSRSFEFLQNIKNYDFVDRQLTKRFPEKVVLTRDSTGQDVLVVNTPRPQDAQFVKLRIQDYYFKSSQIDGSKILNGYEKLNVVGKGAQGTATLFKNKADGKHVIMKVVHTDGMSQTERMQALNEANVLKVLQHPNIIRYIQNFENEGNLHLMMEYADDGSLHRNGLKTASENVFPIATKLQSFYPKKAICSVNAKQFRDVRYLKVKLSGTVATCNSSASSKLNSADDLQLPERCLSVFKSFLHSISHNFRNYLYYANLTNGS